MSLLLLGAALLILGLISGFILVLAPLGIITATPGAMLWILFPLFSLLGYGLCTVTGGGKSLRWLGQVATYSLLMLALVSAAVLVFQAAGMVKPTGSSAWWYVLAVAGSIGVFGAAVLQRLGSRQQT